MAPSKGSNTFLCESQSEKPIEPQADFHQANFETIVLFVSVMLVNLLLQDGGSNLLH